MSERKNQSEVCTRRESHVAILVSDFVNFAAHLIAAANVLRVAVINTAVHLEVAAAVQSEVEQ